MGRWAKVRWTEAGQVTQLLGWAEPDSPQAPPEAFFDALQAAGRLREAAQFLGQALPRYEVVCWASQVVQRLEGAAGEPALAAVLDWVNEPSEARRRGAYEAASLADPESPGRVAALAAYFSGGSISPEGQPAVPAPSTTAGRLGAAAVIMAAVRTRNIVEALSSALQQGDRIATEGWRRP